MSADARLRAAERAARMAGDTVALRAVQAAMERAPECESCGEHVAAVDDNGYCPECAVTVQEHALAHGIAWRCPCGGIGYQDDECTACGALECCAECRYSGYSPSGAVMLSPGWQECPECEGYSAPRGDAGGCGCEASDPSGHECGLPCNAYGCVGGRVRCDCGGGPR